MNDLARWNWARPYAADTAVALLVLAVLYAPLVLPRAGTHGYPLITWLVLAGTALPLVLRRRFPVLCLLTINLFLLWYNALPHAASEPISWGMLVAVYSIAWVGRRWHRVLVTALVLGGAVLTVKSPTTAAIGVLTGVGALLLGALARRSDDRQRELAYRAGQLEQEQRARSQAAVAEERARITRDMHDVLAHAVSLMVVQAEAGAAVVHTDPAGAGRAFDAIAAAGRDALVQLRRTLGLLRREGEDTPRAPQPTIAALPALVEGVRAAGLAASLQMRGTPVGLVPDVEVAAYRIVQEALTNTLKHAAASNVSVLLDWTSQAGRVVITVHDDGCGTDGPGGGGSGLIGIRERAAACGGSAETVAGKDGFTVRAKLPVVTR